MTAGASLRGGYGLYFDQYNTAAAAGDITAQARRPLNALATLTNTAIGVGQLATYRFGIDPLPAQPTEGNRLPLGSQGQWIDVNMVDPRTHQAHLGYAHELVADTTLAVDYTHVEGRNEKRQTNINPIINGRRLLADDFQRVFGAPNYLSDVRILAGINKSRYDALTFLFRRRMPRMTVQAHYTLAGSYSYGGSTGNRSGADLRAGLRPAVRRQRMGTERTGRASPVRVHGRPRGAVAGFSSLPSCSGPAPAPTT